MILSFIKILLKRNQFNQRETIHVLTSTVALKIASNWQVLWNSIPQTVPAALRLSLSPSFESESGIFGARCRTRTCGPMIKSHVLEPTQLNGHIIFGASIIITNTPPYCRQARMLTRWLDFQKTQVWDIGVQLRLPLLHRAQILLHHRVKPPMSHCNYYGGAERI